ncbi:MAG: ABC transporter substrate-binding protein [Myxococcota bacterium]
MKIRAIAMVLVLGACTQTPDVPEETPLLERPWSEIEGLAKGSELTWAMWQGDPFINAYVSDYLTPELKKRFDITLKTVSAQGNDIVSSLMTELEAGRSASAWDMLWINGETFYQLRQIDALTGPFTDVLPNSKYIDFDNPFIALDFQQKVDGYECPWGNVQLALIYDSARVPEPPRNLDALEAWVREHPGRFTFDTQFTGLTFLKSLLIAEAGGGSVLDGPFDEAKYKAASEKLWARLNRMKPFLWKNGESFPNQVSQLHQLFAAGEIDFTMSNNDSEVDNKVVQGTFTDTSRAFVLESGTIQNTHFIGIAKLSSQPAAALVAVNFMISPEAQYEKMKPSVWGDTTILDTQRLPEPWPSKFQSIPERRFSPKRSETSDQALKEPASEYMIRINKDFRSKVIEG